MRFLRAIVVRFGRGATLLVSLYFLMLVLCVRAFRSDSLTKSFLPTTVLRTCNRKTIGNYPTASATSLFPNFRLSTLGGMLQFSLFPMGLYYEGEGPPSAFFALCHVGGGLLFTLRVQRTSFRLRAFSICRVRVLGTLRNTSALLNASNYQGLFPIGGNFQLVVLQPNSLGIVREAILRIGPILFCFM